LPKRLRAGRDEGVKERFVVVGGVLGRRYRVAAITTKGEGRKAPFFFPRLSQPPRASPSVAASW
jgi:hypothetical protein